MVDDTDHPNGTPPPDATSRMPSIGPDEPPDATVVSPPIGGVPVTGLDKKDLNRRGLNRGDQDRGDQDKTEAVTPAPRWAARANVPSPGGAPLRQPGRQPWEEEALEEDPYGDRSWFTPVIVGVVALVLVATIGIGVWLIYRATNKTGVTAVESPSPVASSAVPSSAAPSSAAPSPSPPPSPSVSPTPAAPAEVSIPALRDDTEADARVRLNRLGLNVEVQRRSDPTVAPGRVIDTNPSAGSTVPVGSTVTLIVASTPSSPPSRPPSTAAPPRR